jgi:hypothetical protein
MVGRLTVKRAMAEARIAAKRESTTVGHSYKTGTGR